MKRKACRRCHQHVEIVRARDGREIALAAKPSRTGTYRLSAGPYNRATCEREYFANGPLEPSEQAVALDRGEKLWVEHSTVCPGRPLIAGYRPPNVQDKSGPKPHTKGA